MNNFHLYHVGKCYMLMRWWWRWCPLCTKTTSRVGSYSVSFAKQQFLGRHVAQLEHNILILTGLCYLITGEATYTNVLAFCLTRMRLEPTIYLTRSEHAYNYTSDALEKKDNASFNIHMTYMRDYLVRL